MYVYDEYDQRIVEDRVKQFRDQTRRYLAGELTGEEFRPLRLQNGLYIQRYAPMLRIAVPYGLLSSRQLRKLAQIAHDDKGYAHISTRQNVQFNWPELEDVPEILAELATVQMRDPEPAAACTHHRPVRRRRPRRTGGPGAHPVNLPPRVRPPAAQVQDRGERRGERPCRHRGARHRPGGGEERGRPARLPRLGRRRPGPEDPDRRQLHQ